MTEARGVTLDGPGSAETATRYESVGIGREMSIYQEWISVPSAGVGGTPSDIDKIGGAGRDKSSTGTRSEPPRSDDGGVRQEVSGASRSRNSHRLSLTVLPIRAEVQATLLQRSLDASRLTDKRLLSRLTRVDISRAGIL